MLRRLSLRDFVIVATLEVEFDAGFSVLTGETGAGKSILVDALQLALGSRGDAGLVREGAARADIGARSAAAIHRAGNGLVLSITTVSSQVWRESAGRGL